MKRTLWAIAPLLLLGACSSTPKPMVFQSQDANKIVVLEDETLVCKPVLEKVGFSFIESMDAAKAAKAAKVSESAEAEAFAKAAEAAAFSKAIDSAVAAKMATHEEVKEQGTEVTDDAVAAKMATSEEVKASEK